MHWNRSNALGLAKASCTYCQGDGIRLVHKGKEVPCNCVFRAVFRACYNRFRECAVMAEHTSSVSLELCRGRDSRRVYSRKREEYMADFCLIARRELDSFDYSIFRFHFLLGADWKLCCRQLKVDRGNFFHAVYRIQQILGCAFAEMEPYSLYPLNEYFGTTVSREAQPSAIPATRQSAARPGVSRLPAVA